MKNHPFLGMFLLFIGIFMFGYFVTSGLVFLVCFCFGLEFSWRLSLGAYVITIVIRKLIKEAKR